MKFCSRACVRALVVVVKKNKTPNGELKNVIHTTRRLRIPLPTTSVWPGACSGSSTLPGTWTSRPGKKIRLDYNAREPGLQDLEILWPSCFIRAVLTIRKNPGEISLYRFRPAGDQTLKGSGQAGSKGRAPLFLVFKQNLNLSSWRIWHINNNLKQIRNEKVTVPKVKRIKNSKKTNHQTVPKHIFKHSKNSLYVVLYCHWSSKIICKTSGDTLIAL